MAHRHFVSQMLALVTKQMAGLAREGEITHAAAAFQEKRVIGSWKVSRRGGGMTSRQKFWCAIHLARGAHVDATVDRTGIPLCRECLAENAALDTGVVQTSIPPARFVPTSDRLQ